MDSNIDDKYEKVDYDTYYLKDEVIYGYELGHKIMSFECKSEGIEISDFRCPNYDDLRVSHTETKVIIVGKSREVKKKKIRLHLKIEIQEQKFEKWILVNMT